MGKASLVISGLLTAAGMAGSAGAAGTDQPFIIERMDGTVLPSAARTTTASAPQLRTSSVVTLGDDSVSYDTLTSATAPSVAAYNAVPVGSAAPSVAAPAAPTVVAMTPAPNLATTLPPPPAPVVLAPPPTMPMVAAPTMVPMASQAMPLDRRSYKRAMKARRAWERAMRRCGSDCRQMMAYQGQGEPRLAWAGHYGPSAYYGLPMTPPAPVVTHGTVPGMAGASYEQTQYAGQYANGYYYPGQTVTKITIDPGTMVVTQPAPTVSTYYAAPIRAATPRRAKAVRYRSKLVRGCAC